MERSKHEAKVLAILSGDWHLREDSPLCFVGDFQKEQWIVVDYIKDLQKEFDCPVICSGDLFDYWKPSLGFLAEVVKHLPRKLYVVYGNHDLPQHNVKLAGKSGVHLLAKVRRLTILSQCHWGLFPIDETEEQLIFPDKNLLVWHTMTYQKEKPYPGCEDPKAISILKKYPQYDLILTGHNHKSFHEEYHGRLLINPGSITRQKADQIDHHPVVYLWREDNSITLCPLPYTEDSISREHLEVIEQRDSRIEAFISRLDAEWEIGVSFEKNLEAYLRANKVKESISQIIYKAIES